MDPFNTLEALGAAKGLKFLHWNVRSLPRKIDQIRVMLSGINLDVVTLSETWLRPYLSTKAVDIEGYTSFRLDRDKGATSRKGKRGGGLITYINNKFASRSEVLENMSISNEHVEALWVHINMPFCKNMYVCNMYRPPSGDLKKAISYLDECLKLINLDKNNVFLLGDMNVNYKNKKSPNFKRFNFFAQSNGMTQFIKNATRNTDKTNSLIDIALSNSKFVNSSGTLDHFISDHQPIYLLHKKARDTRPKVQFKGRTYRNFDVESFKSALVEADWTAFYNSADSEVAWRLMQEHVISVLDKMCPIRTFHIRNYRPDWMGRDLIEQIKDRDYFYKQAKKTGGEDLWNIAKYLRNITNTNIRCAKWDFVLSELKKNENNAKKFWQVIRSVIPSDKSNSHKDIMLKDGTRELDRSEVAHFINDYFINVGNVSTDKSSDPSPPLIMMGDSLASDHTSDYEHETHSMNELRELEVHRVIKSINTSKSSGLDNISSTVIKRAFETLTPQVTFMFNLSIPGAQFPDIWKRALVVPIPKQGNLTKVQNYRPISLLPLPGKILEKLVHHQLSDYLETEMLLAGEQHGFRRNHSTIHSIEQVTSFINKKMDAKLPTAAVFVDFRKAFDCVQHPVLLNKLRNLGLSELVINWVDNYLTNRKQRVYANDTFSDYLDVTQGVPQGSVLGPLFYIVYANDIACSIKHCKLAMYADDTVIYTSHINFNVAVANLQHDINLLADWCTTNGIKANTDKTKVMVFGSQCSLAKTPPFEIKFGDVLLQKVSSYKYLGLTLDAQLNYNLHVNGIIRSVSSKLKQFRRMRSFLNTRAALMIYKGTILPILEYGDIFFSATSAENRRRLQVLQNRGLRCALIRDADSGSTELHSEAHLLKLCHRREQHTLNFMYDNAQLITYHKTGSKMSVKTRSSRKILLKIKRPRTEKFKRSMAYIGPWKWNALPDRFHHTQTKALYKTMISTWITQKATTSSSPQVY